MIKVHTRRLAGRVAVGLGVGAGAWSLTEYVSHRWVLHGPFGRGRLKRLPLGSIHRSHHGDPAHTVLAGRLAGHAAIAGVGAVGAVALGHVVHVAVARAAAAAWALGYSTYDITHWCAHHRAPRSEWGRQMRRRHYRHHFGHPKSNLGVTMDWWDKVFGTEAEAAPVSIPPRHVPDWLLEAPTALRTEFASDFTIDA